MAVNEAGNYTKPGMRKRLFNRIKAGGDCEAYAPPTTEELKAKNTTIGIVINDIKVDVTIVLAMLSTIFFGEYILPTK